MSEYVNRLMRQVVAKNPGEPEFHQAVHEVAESVELALDPQPPLSSTRKIFERILEPERVIDLPRPVGGRPGEVQINRGFRVEMSSAIGPYKGGLRFHPTVYLGMLKFLAFEQVFKNALTTLPLGARQGRRGLRPEGPVRRRGHALLPVLHDRAAAAHRSVHRRPGRRHRRGRPRDRVPVRPVQADPQRVHRRAHRQGHERGAARSSGRRRPATGRSTSPREMLGTRDETLEGKRCLVSGAGNVAQYTVEKLLDLGASPVTLSDSGGFIYDKDGIDRRSSPT